MQVTTATKTAEGQLFNLNNGDAVLIKGSVNLGGKPCTYPVYVFASGAQYSARTGRFASTTIRSAMAAVRRFQAT